jgi:hypothetical protein
MRSGAMLTATFKVTKVGKRSGPRRSAISTTSATPTTPVGRIPRVARLMALAIKLDGLIRSGEVTSQRELAAVARVTPARVTQIMNLLHLCPQIQEQLLLLEPVTRGKDAVTERELRAVVCCVRWCHQERVWRTISRSL